MQTLEESLIVSKIRPYKEGFGNTQVKVSDFIDITKTKQLQNLRIFYQMTLLSKLVIFIFWLTITKTKCLEI